MQIALNSVGHRVRVVLQCPDLLRQPFSDLFRIPRGSCKIDVLGRVEKLSPPAAGKWQPASEFFTAEEGARTPDPATLPLPTALEPPTSPIATPEAPESPSTLNF